jgi:tetratricopeptide (TPR) repeat protein
MAKLTTQQVFDLASEHHRAGRLSEAERLYRVILSQQPEHAGALHYLGVIAYQSGNKVAALELIQRAIALGAGDSSALSNLGAALKDLGKLDEAEAACRRALELNPDSLDAHLNLGYVLSDQDKPGEAAREFERAAAIAPESVKPLFYLGNALCAEGRLEEGGEAYRRAIALQPDYADAHGYLSLSLLLRGEFEAGWKEYEWRWKSDEFQSIGGGIDKPRWDGSDLAGRTILVHAEQGFGDTIQFIRYLPLVAQRGGKVVVQVHKELIRLLRQVPGAQEWLTNEEKPPAFDVYCPLLSLPGMFGTTLETIPGPVPYLFAEGELVENWKRRLGPRDGKLRVGLVWAGSTHFKGDRTRSLMLDKLSVFGGIKGVRFYSLQKGAAGQQAKHPPEGLELVDLGEGLEDFADTAAVMQLMDLIVTTDTSIPHLAGAMGRPVWVMLQKIPYFTWMLDRKDCPWYPTVRMFRQSKHGDWGTPIGEVRRELQKLSKGG